MRDKRSKVILSRALVRCRLFGSGISKSGFGRMAGGLYIRRLLCRFPHICRNDIDFFSCTVRYSFHNKISSVNLFCEFHDLSRTIIPIVYFNGCIL